MSAWLTVVRTPAYERDLQDVHDYIELDNPDVAMKMLLQLEHQVDSLSDPNFPRRPGRVPGTQELVAHANYIVVMRQSNQIVTVLNILHVAKIYP